MIRLLVSLPVAILMSLLLFYGLALITRVGSGFESVVSQVPNLNFLMVHEDSAIERRKRQLPPEPEIPVEQQQPDMPQMEPVTALQIETPVPTIKVPNIDLGIAVNLAPTLNDLPAPKPVAVAVPKVQAPAISIDTNPTVLSRVSPRYPRSALRRRLQGAVVVEFIVTKTGTVKPESLIVVESTPPGVFDKSVLRAIKRWKFKIRTQDGRAVAFRARQKLEFKLEKS